MASHFAFALLNFLSSEAAGSGGDGGLAVVVIIIIIIVLGVIVLGVNWFGWTVWSLLTTLAGIVVGLWGRLVVIITGGAGRWLDRVAGWGVLADGCRAADGGGGRRSNLALDDGGHVGLKDDLGARHGWEGGAGEAADTVRARGEIGEGWGAVGVAVLAPWLLAIVFLTGGLLEVVVCADGSGHGSGHEDGAENFA